MFLYPNLAVNHEEELEKLNDLLIKGARAEVQDGELIIFFDEQEVKTAKSRNAGRKKSDEKWTESFNTFCELYKSQKSIKEIMNITGFSRATCYRYKKIYDCTEGVYEEWKSEKDQEKL